MNTFNRTCLVAMSGGVDSSVAALMMLNKGFYVIGITYRLWQYNENPPFMDNAVQDAKKICNKLGIQHIDVDVSEVFKKDVVNDFYDEYAHGRTPNPCILCNPKIKWKFLIKIADKMNINHVITGHYAGIENFNDNYFLCKGVDTSRDQSYFLYRLTQDVLKRTIFPLGNLTKDEVYKLAQEHSLPINSALESREICFINSKDFQVFMSKYAPSSILPGKLYDSSGNLLNMHKGIAFYTIGQREGLGGGYKQPMYVLEINATENSIIIGTKSELFSKKFIVENIAMNKIESEFFTTVKVRYRHPGACAKITINPEIAIVEFQKAQEAIAPGQSAVFYDNNRVIGGGIIKQVLE